jgi:glycosyltransferase involved in cell wall biosynthesis
MKIRPFLSVVIPVLNESAHLPRLFRALEAQKIAAGKILDVIFVDNGSKDDSRKKISVWMKKKNPQMSVRLFLEDRRGFAPPLNLGVSSARHRKVATLDADCYPAPDWATEMYRALSLADIIVGETKSISGNSSAEKLAAKLFKNYSYRTSHAEGFALPWGPACNLGFQKEIFRSCKFLPEAGAAFDIDWCWRSVLAGATIAYAANVLAYHQRRTDEGAFLNQMFRYGTGEAWIQSRFAPLSLDDRLDPCPELYLSRALAASSRIRETRTEKNLHALANQAAVAFACGVYDGYSKLKMKKMEKLPRRPVAWRKNQEEISVFVPGKGILDLSGAGILLWDTYVQGGRAPELQKALQRHFHISSAKALHEAKHFLQAIR